MYVCVCVCVCACVFSGAYLTDGYVVVVPLAIVIAATLVSTTRKEGSVCKAGGAGGGQISLGGGCGGVQGCGKVQGEEERST